MHVSILSRGGNGDGSGAGGGPIYMTDNVLLSSLTITHHESCGHNTYDNERCMGPCRHWSTGTGTGTIETKPTNCPRCEDWSHLARKTRKAIQEVQGVRRSMEWRQQCPPGILTVPQVAQMMWNGEMVWNNEKSRRSSGIIDRRPRARASSYSMVPVRRRWGERMTDGQF